MMRATQMRTRSHSKLREADRTCQWRATSTVHPAPELPRCVAQYNGKSEFITSLSLRPWKFFPKPISDS
jgi:hypothetical protein